MAQQSVKSEDDKKAFDDFRKMIAEANYSQNMGESLISFQSISWIINLMPNLFLDKILLERYLKVSDNNLDNAFGLLKHGLELRQKAPYLFTNRDLSASEIQTACTTL